MDRNEPIGQPRSSRQSPWARSGSLDLVRDQIDVLIIGSGFAGLTAAIEAAKAGATVVILEKMKAPGGNSVISDGGIAAPGTTYQQDAGIIDSPEQMYDDMLAAGEGLNYPELVQVVTEGAREAFLWTRDDLGVQYENRVDIFGGHSVPRCYTPVGISGSALIKCLLARLEKLSVPIRLGIYVESLLQDETERVIGVRYREDFVYGQPVLEPVKLLFARKAVIVATGGFGSDVAFRKAQDPRLDDQLMSTNKPFATAEILKECLRIGANPVQLSRIQLGAWASPDEKGFGAGPLFGDYVVFPYGVMIDPETGARFTSELSDRRLLAEALLKQKHPVIGIADATAVETAGWDLSKALTRGVVKTFASWEALAEHYQIDSQALQQSITRFNQMIRQGVDQDFHKPILKEACPVEQPPFYAMRLWPKVHHTMGGIQIDTSARVIHRDQHPIEGLFAAGEVTGGIHGACRLGSCAITECLVMGKMAGRTAVK